MGNVLKKYNSTKDQWEPVGGTITGDTLPIGAMMPYGNLNAPAGWLICDGSAISRTTYADLFAVIGTSYGAGDGSTTFNLPNKKGRVSAGYDSSNANFNAIGKKLGEETHTLTTDETPKHVHGLRYFDSNYQETDQVDTLAQSAFAGYVKTYRSVGATYPAGGGQPHNNIQPTEVDNWIIKAFQSAGVVANVSGGKTYSNTDVYSCNYINNNMENKTQLYSSGGTAGDITLSETKDNFEFIEVWYHADQQHRIIRFPANVIKFSVPLEYVNENSFHLLFCSTYGISENQISFLNAKNDYISNENVVASYGTSAYINIYKVFGINRLPQ